MQLKTSDDYFSLPHTGRGWVTEANDYLSVRKKKKDGGFKEEEKLSSIFYPYSLYSVFSIFSISVSLFSVFYIIAKLVKTTFDRIQDRFGQIVTAYKRNSNLRDFLVTGK
jgi:hypothetical protein